MRIIRWVKYAVAPAALLLVGASMQAQATRTWVSGVGDDVNPCSRTAPCKTWAGAISKTALGGVIDALDPGGYGALTITKAITVEGNGTLASGLSSGVNGFIVNITSGTNRDVVLRNILSDGSGTTLGTNGVRFIAGDSLTIENSSFEQYSGQGIDFEPNSANARLTLRNVTITQAGGNGVLVKPAVGGTARVMIDDSTIVKNVNGVRVEDNGNVVINRSTIANNTSDGVHSFSNGGSVVVVIEDSAISVNGGIGLRTTGGNSVLRVSNSVISLNGTGLNATGGELSTYQNNRVALNGVAGAFTGNAVPGNQ
jgi:hypothetical protein